MNLEQLETKKRELEESRKETFNGHYVRSMDRRRGKPNQIFVQHGIEK